MIARRRYHWLKSLAKSISDGERNFGGYANRGADQGRPQQIQPKIKERFLDPFATQHFRGSMSEILGDKDEGDQDLIKKYSNDQIMAKIHENYLNLGLRTRRH